mmetsp:Transcript_67099/g.151655  ORF Transcript_67099/g.151655 Transcript_67099/m.151655 type:complete len:266 (+) Transcript_67099:467-1264(+)
MAEAGDDLPGCEGLLGIGGEQLLCWLLPPKVLLHLQEPREALLVREAVEWPRQATDAGGPGVVGVAEGGSHEVRGVGRDVAALVVSVEHEVEAGALLELLVRVHAEHLRVVGCPVELAVVGQHLAILERAPVDVSRDNGGARHKVQCVLECPLPVLRLLHALVILGREDGVLLHGEHRHRQLRHGVGRRGEGVQGLHDSRRHRAAAVKLLREGPGLLRRGHLAREQQPEGCLRQAGLATRGLGEDLVDLVQRPPAVIDAIVRIKV